MAGRTPGPARRYGLFGYFGMPIGITDGRYTLQDPERLNEMLEAMAGLFDESDAPAELYRRYGLRQPAKDNSRPAGAAF